MIWLIRWTTSVNAASMSAPHTNCTMTSEKPWRERDSTCLTLATAETAFSRGYVTLRSMSWALAPL